MLYLLIFSRELTASLKVYETQVVSDNLSKPLMEATHRLSQFQEQNSVLQAALKQAKELLMSQEKKLKDKDEQSDKLNLISNLLEEKQKNWIELKQNCLKHKSRRKGNSD